MKFLIQFAQYHAEFRFAGMLSLDLHRSSDILMNDQELESLAILEKVHLRYDPKEYSNEVRSEVIQHL
jgi:hypothetical protein